MTIRFHKGDLPDLSRYTGDVAIDTETQGLNPLRDRLCVVQLSPGDGTADVIQIARLSVANPMLRPSGEGTAVATPPGPTGMRLGASRPRMSTIQGSRSAEPRSETTRIE